MNPPPYRPPQEGKNPLVRQILLASLIAVPIFGLVAFGAYRGIVAQQKSRAGWQEVKSSAGEIHDDLKKNYDPKTGVTNVDLSKFDKMRDGLKNVSRNSTGDDARIADAMTGYLDRMQAAVKNYQDVATKLRAARVLDNFDSSDQKQIPARRQIVLQFLEANGALKQVITNSEDRIRADLVQAKVPEYKIDRVLDGFHASVAPKNVLTIKIRQCDDKIGGAMLDALDMLATEWGHWRADATVDKIIFRSTTAREAYEKDLADLKAAANEQIKLQGVLVNQANPQP
jgi:hypothetical protein